MDNQPTDPNLTANGNPQAPGAAAPIMPAALPTAAEVAQQQYGQLQQPAQPVPPVQPMQSVQPAPVEQDDNGILSIDHDPRANRVMPAVAAAEEETQDPGLMVVQRSKHQQYMDALKSSGKTMAEIQAAWHHYYTGLNDEEKHEVWREFYESDKQATDTTKAAATPDNTTSTVHTGQASATTHETTAAGAATTHEPTKTTAHEGIKTSETSSVKAEATTNADGDTEDKPNNSVPEGINQQVDEQVTPETKANLLKTIRKRVKIRPRQQLQSLFFGLACGAVAVVVVLFGFFNEVIIAPFIQPSRTVNNTPIIIGADGLAPTDKSEVIIPKINVEIPLDFSAKTLKEEDIQRGLENGVVHYPSTPLPGQVGNTSFFGHSSNNIFNSGKYKFAFVLLHELQVGDTFYLTRNGVAYAYQVFDKKVVEPNNVGILNPIAGKTATATLITCDPPGTTLRRLVVVGEQVSPAPGTNQPGGIQKAEDSGVKALPGNGPTLWQRFMKLFR